MRNHYRRNGMTVILVHPSSRTAMDYGLSRHGWRRIGRTRVGIDDPHHPGLVVYEDVSLLGRIRRMLGTGVDELRNRSITG